MIYFVNFIIALPIMFAYFYWEGFNILSLLIYIIGFLLIPLIPTIVMSLLSLGISLFTSKLRYSKIINLIIMVIVFIGIMALSTSMSNTTVNPLTGQIDLFTNIKYYPPNGLIKFIKFITICFGCWIYHYLACNFIEKFMNKRGTINKKNYLTNKNRY